MILLRWPDLLLLCLNLQDPPMATLHENFTILHGLISRLTPVGNSDLMLELLTYERGRLCVFARGARASRKRFGGMLDYFVSLTFHISNQSRNQSGCPQLRLADAQKMRLALRCDLQLLTQANRLLACGRLLMPEHQAMPEFLRHLEDGLDRLVEDHLLNADLSTALLRMATAAGILPAHPATFIENALKGQRLEDSKQRQAVDRYVFHWIRQHIGEDIALPLEIR